MKIKLLVTFIVGFLLGLFLGWFSWGNVESVSASLCVGHTEWSEWAYKEDVTECLPVAECGTSEGTKTIKEKRTCEWDNGCGVWECQFGEKQYRETEVKCEVETPECEPKITPVPVEPFVDRGTHIASPPPEPICKDLGGYAPTITKVSRVDNDTVSACWTKPSDNADSYLIWYGTEEENLPWNTITKNLCVELNEVPNTHIWLKVAGKSEGCVGNFSIVTDP